MARDQIDMTPLQSRDELVAWLEAGVKPPSEFRIGTEHEKTPFTLRGHHPVAYEGARGIGALLEGMQLLLGWEPIMERGNIIGLYDVTGGGAISLEPGGQFELSGAPVENVHQTQSELMAHLAQVREIAAPLGIGFLGLGMTPSWSRAQIPVMPKGRYKIMTDYMPKVGQVHLPPPTHLTFTGPGYVICSFCPRPFDFDPNAVPIPYAHSNIDSDEVLYYVDGNFMSRKGIDMGSITLHPYGIPHGPQPGLLEKSLTAKETGELAVMVDTFRPLKVAKVALTIDDAGYPYSWQY
jgi:hypothetical protein